MMSENDADRLISRNLAMMPYSNQWRAFRKQFHSSFREQEVKTARSMILDTSVEFLNQLCTSPDQLRFHIRS